MNHEDYQKVKKIFQAALDIAPGERAAFLDKACQDNEDLRREVEKLLNSFDSQFLEMPAVARLADIVIEEKTEDEPTKILSDDESEPTKILSDAEPEEPPDENALRPSRLRFALVGLLFVFAVGALTIALVQVFSRQTIVSNIGASWENGRRIITQPEPNVANLLRVGDEIMSINNKPINVRNYQIILTAIKPGEHFNLQIKREGESELREITFVAEPTPFVITLTYYILGILLPLVYLLSGLVIFLFKPNNKQVLLLTVTNILSSMSVAPFYYAYFLDLPAFFGFWWQAGSAIRWYSGLFFVHFVLVFPERSPLLRRFPKLEWLIYVPYVFCFTPTIVLTQLAYAGWTQFDFILNSITYLLIINVHTAVFTFAALAILIFNYVKAETTVKRRISLLVAGILASLVPTTLNNLVVRSVNVILNIDLLGDWGNIIWGVPMFLGPLAFAYAIIRHKVIPISFVIRRGLQYLLAKNALRLLLVLPILGIVWNIAANPSRRLDEILLQNSFGFYLYILLVAILVLANRFGLREWIDRKFFREQYKQEKVLRELTVAVQESDSLTKLSRLVSSKIQAALHPESVYLFFRDDAHQSDFSLGYSTSASSETSSNLKLAADSPLLRFMQRQREAIDFPFKENGDLPPRESVWLHSIGANLLVPMHGTDRKLAGFFSLGEKKSEIPYTGRDKELLETLAQQIALVHENLNLKDRMRHEQRIKTEVLSRFDEGNINLLKECPRCSKCFDRKDEKCADDNSELTFSLPVERTIENRYRLEKLIGKGGMGAVYEATDLRINRRVAVKILSGAMFGNRDALRRFEREAQTAGRLQHHNIVTVFDYGVLSTEGAFLVMELVSGESLGEVLKRENKLDSAMIADWFSQVLEGVEAAHKAGIVHRDLKPENIFVSASETGETRLCILDFGLARLSETEIAAGNVTVPGTVVGTFGYMPPEQLRGEKVDGRSDLFAIGVMIYEALRGEKPFAGKSYHELLTAMSDGIEFDSDMRLSDFFERGLANKPENRFASASEMKRNLKAVIASLQN